MMSTIAQELASAIRDHQSGNITRAEEGYRQILRVDPNHVDALHLTGVAALQTGKPHVAIEFIGRALQVHGADAKLYTHIGAAYRSAGKFAEAVEAYRQALRIDPDCAPAHFNLGVAFAAEGRDEEALASYSRAIEFQPDYAEAHHNAGVVLQRTGRVDEALLAYEKAIQLQPRYAEAFISAASAFRQQGRMREAVFCYDKALELAPQNAELHVNRGSVLQAEGRLDEAAHAYLEALRIRPELLAAFNNLGLVRHAQGQFAEAADWYRKALSLDDRHVAVLNNMGVTLEKLVALDAAIEHYQAALRSDPNHCESLNNLGLARQLQGNLDEAEALYLRTLQIAPLYAETHYNLGNLRKIQGRLPDAITSYLRALELRPGYAAARNNLGTLYNFQGRLDEARGCFEHVLRQNPESGDAHNNLGTVLQHQGKHDEALVEFRHALRINPENSLAHSNILIGLNYDSETDAETNFREHRLWGERHGRSAVVSVPHLNHRESERPLKIGYVSADFRAHPVSAFFEPILVHHDRRQFEIFCYAEVAAPDRITARFRELASHWRNTSGVGDPQLDLQIRTDQIDILVDLSGHTSGNRLTLFARRPAPVQVSYLGYCNTTGLSSIDYRITDAVADPIGEPIRHTEDLLRLPGGFCCYSPPDPAPPVSPLPAFRSGAITFGSLHNLAKLNRRVLDLWCGLLSACPETRLLVARHTLTDAIRAELQARFQERGIGADRVELRRAGVSGNRYLRIYDEIDVALDVFPWSGHTTACESLWMGVPVITLWGPSHRQRMVSSVLNQVGLTEFIAGSPEEYIEIASALRHDLSRLAQVRRTLRQRVAESTLLDGARFTRHLEDAYRAIWRSWCGASSHSLSRAG